MLGFLHPEHCEKRFLPNNYIQLHLRANKALTNFLDRVMGFIPRLFNPLFTFKGLRMKFKTLFMSDEEKHGDNFDLPLFFSMSKQFLAPAWGFGC